MSAEGKLEDNKQNGVITTKKTLPDLPDDFVQACETRVRTKKGSFRWTVRGFTDLDMGNNNYIFSSPFRVAGLDWKLSLCPGQGDPCSISIYLELDSQVDADFQQKVCFTLTFINEEGKDNTPPESGRERRAIYEAEKKAFGHRAFCRRDSLLRNGFLVNNTLIIKLEMTVHLGIEVTPTREMSDTTIVPLSLPMVPSSSFPHRVHSLLHTGLHSDVTLVAEGVRIPAHKALLSLASPVFKAMFSHNMAETRSNEVKVEDVTEHALHLLLSYIYSDQMEAQNWADGMALLQLSDKWVMPRLKALASHALYKMLANDNVVAIMQLADAVGCSGLKEECLSFTVKHLEAVSQTSDFSRLVAGGSFGSFALGTSSPTQSPASSPHHPTFHSAFVSSSSANSSNAPPSASSSSPVFWSHSSSQRLSREFFSFLASHSPVSEDTVSSTVGQSKKRRRIHRTPHDGSVGGGGGGIGGMGGAAMGGSPPPAAAAALHSHSSTAGMATGGAAGGGGGGGGAAHTVGVPTGGPHAHHAHHAPLTTAAGGVHAAAPLTNAGGGPTGILDAEEGDLLSDPDDEAL